MKKEKIMAMVATIFEKGAASTIVTKKSANSAMRKTDNPYLNRVEVRTTYYGYVMGTDYASSLKEVASRMGNKNAEPNLRKCWHTYYNEWFNTDDKTRTKFYLKIQRNAMQVAHKVVREWFVDGRKATDAEVKEISNFLPKKEHKQSATQTEMGIDKAHEQSYLVLGLETLVSIKQNEKILIFDDSKNTKSEVTEVKVGVENKPILIQA